MVDGRVALIGYGVSNKAVYEFLKSYGCDFVIRSKDPVSDHNGIRCIVGDGYLDTEEEIVFRSPSCMPWRIRGKGAVFSEASFSLPLLSCRKIGVTGSDGKTTVSTLINAFLREGGISSYMGGNNGYPLIKYLGSIRKKDTLVCELSSFQLVDMTPMLDTAVITGITENHLDIHCSMEEYARSKANALVNCKCAVINADNAYADFFIKNATGCGKTVLATIDESKVAYGDTATYVYPKNGYIYHGEEALFPVSCIHLMGNFNILNVCMAVGAVYPTVSADCIRRALDRFYGVPSRMEFTAIKNGISFYDSSIDSTPARTVATLSAFERKKTLVLLGGYDKNLSYDSLREGLAGIKCAIISGANSEKIYRSLKGVCKIALCADLKESIKTAYRIAEEGDSVILSPASASFDAFENYKERSEKFKETVRGL